MNEIIERLKNKDYVRAFGLMKPEEQTTFIEVGKKNCLCWQDNSEWVIPIDSIPFYTQYTYAIKPDYQPEPEYVDLEIIKKYSSLDIHSVEQLGCWLEWQYFSKYPLNNIFVPLNYLPSLPNFDKFWVDDFENGNISIDAVSRNINNGHKVYARFRK